MFWARVQADPIDLHSSVQDGYGRIFTLKDQFTRYLVLFALQSKEAEAVKEKFSLVLKMFGAPKSSRQTMGESL